MATRRSQGLLRTIWQTLGHNTVLQERANCLLPQGSAGACLDPHFLQQYRGIHTQKKRLGVVMCSHMEGVGRPGDVVRVAPGYARNLLVPYKLALPALEKNVKAVREAKEKGVFGSPEEEQDETEAKPQPKLELSAADRAAEAAEAARRLDVAKLSIRRSVPRRTNQARQPVEAKDIVLEVSRQLGISLDVRNLVIGSPLQTIGLHEIALRFPEDVVLPGGKEQISLKVNLRRA